MSTDFNNAFSQDWLAGLQSMGSQMGPVPVSVLSDPVNTSPVATAPVSLNVGMPNVPGASGGFLKGFGMDEAKLALGGLQTLGQLWGAWQSAKLAKKNFNLQRDWGETNMANQIRSYNTQLDGIARSRGVVEGQSAAQVQQYIEENKARRHNGG